MNYRPFGRLGWQVSEIGFGAWAIGGSWGPQDDAESVRALHRALELGCNFLDTAQIYGDGKSERVIAEAMKSHRDRTIYVATKIPPTPGAWPCSPYDDVDQRYPAAYLSERVERSLRDLKTDVLDVVQLHTWSRAFNKNPTCFEHLRRLQKQGKIRGIGVSSPEHDQNALVQLIRDGWVDCVQVIYNIFDQESQAELFPAAVEANVGVIVRVPFDESSLTGKLTRETKFAAEDFRNAFFSGDRLARTVDRVEKIRATVGDREPDLATAALKFALKPSAVSTVIPGIRNSRQAELNIGVSGLSAMSDALEMQLRGHAWNRAFWYAGK